MGAKKIIIAIDGYSSCGKSTLAKALAKKLHYVYADSGAMYRAVTLFFIENNIDIDSQAAVVAALPDVHIHFERIDGRNHTFLNGRDVESLIRQMFVSELVSPVATIPEVRRDMVRQQKAMGNRKGIVMDGRDIGTVVFPDAELKIFLTADPEVRAQRRADELANNGDIVPLAAVKQNLLDRDRIDSTRADSPLRQADDARVIDNSLITENEQLEIALTMAKEVIEQL